MSDEREGGRGREREMIVCEVESKALQERHVPRSPWRAPFFAAAAATAAAATAAAAASSAAAAKMEKRRDETDEEKRARRLAKKAAKREKEVAQLAGYSNESNPWNDPNLADAFVWGKNDKSGSVASADAMRRRRAEQLEELEKVKKALSSARLTVRRGRRRSGCWSASASRWRLPRTRSARSSSS